MSYPTQKEVALALKNIKPCAHGEMTEKDITLSIWNHIKLGEDATYRRGQNKQNYIRLRGRTITYGSTTVEM